MFRDTSLKAEELFEQTIKLDPNFAAAFAGLSMWKAGCITVSTRCQHGGKKRGPHANEALRLQPDLPEAHLALGFSYYYGDRDYERALAEFEIAKRGLPNEAHAYYGYRRHPAASRQMGGINGELGKGRLLDPKNSVPLNLGYNYMATRNFEAADKLFDRAIEAVPESFGSRCIEIGVGDQMERRH